MKKVAQWSAFFLAVVVLGFLLHPAAVWIIHTVNDGTTSDCHPATPDGNGWCWTSSYTRFVPSDYEHGFVLGIDLAISMLFASGLFYGAMLVVRQRKAGRQDTVPMTAPAKPAAKSAETSARFRRRLFLIPAWLAAQYVWNLFSGETAGQALAMMTAIVELWPTAIVITVIVLYAKGYEIGYGNDTAKKTGPESKKSDGSTRPF
jgi:hypothetical protein